MMAWSRALAADGQIDQARTIAQRLREFRNPQAEEYFEVCEAAPASAANGASEAAFQCAPPARAPGWREFLPR